jgi:hypothetical protein
MGLIVSLLTLPLAPVRGVAWVAEQVLEEAERQWRDPHVIQAALLDVEERRERGELTPEEAAAMEEELVGRLLGDG